VIKSIQERLAHEDGRGNVVPDHFSIFRAVGYRRLMVRGPAVTSAIFRIALVCAYLVASHQNVAVANPIRLVSFNLCKDQRALEFGNVGQVLGLSSMSRNPALSYHSKLAGSVPAMRSATETILRLAPDLVLVGAHDARYTISIPSNAGMRIQVLPQWNTLAETKMGVIEAAASMGHGASGSELVADIDRSLANLRNLLARMVADLSFLLLQRRGYAQREGVTAEVLEHVGLRDASDQFALTIGGAFVPIEKLIAARPDYLVVSEALTVAEDQGQAIFLHPTMRRLYPAGKRLIVPDVFSICSGPSTPALID